MTPADQPYLSLVVAARYDDHGGNFMRRMQAFVDAFVAQCRRHRVTAEIIIVEWNPLRDRCGLAQALEWPIEMDWCQVRVIEVPPEIHARYEHSPKIPLYQMIAKNVGIRRACGEFVLATNIDILFNDALMSFLAERRLERGKLYRIDRHDADEAIPLWASVDEQLDYCEDHLLRVTAREGTFPLDERGRRTWASVDIGKPKDGVALGQGWYAPETVDGQTVRYIADGAVVELPPLTEGAQLTVSMEPGPGAGGAVTVSFVRADGSVAAKHTVVSRSDITLPLSENAGPSEMRVGVEAMRARVSSDPRGLVLRAMSIRLMGAVKRKAGQKSAPELALDLTGLNYADRLAIWTQRSLPMVHRAVAPAYRRATGRPEPVLATRPRKVRRGASASAPPDVPIHINTCGDFTMMHRDDWMDMRGYAEFDAYSMNIDAAFCWAAHYAGYREEVLCEPMRIYHIEHDHGSGWTPEGRDVLFKRINKAGVPWIDYQDVMTWVRTMGELNCPVIFNRGNWGFRDETLQEYAPGLEPADAELRWCAADAESPSQTKARAEGLCKLRTLGPYPGWKFDADYYSGDAALQPRRAIWERCARLGWKLGVMTPWYEKTRVALDMRNEIARQVFVGGCYDPNEFHWLSQVLKPGMVFLDIGANEGLYSVFAAARVGVAGRVVALEPSARELAALEANVALNGFQNVVTRRLALGDRAGTVALRVAVAEHAGLNSIGEFGVEGVAVERVEEVPLATLDQLMLELKPTRLDVVKMDIEGSETAVLRGAIATIERFRPWLLVELAERSLTKLGSSSAELSRLLRRLGYDLLAIDAATGLPVPWNGETPPDSMNLICRPAGQS